jgi:aspartyl aminopeptidase
MTIKDYYNMAMKVADEVLKDPMKGVGQILKDKLGYEKGLKGFFSDPWNLLLLSQPLGLAGRVLYKYMKNKERQRMEMEMMKRNIIAKQQAIIKKMEEENIQNEEQKKNMQETIDFLQETLDRIEAARKNKKP